MSHTAFPRFLTWQTQLGLENANDNEYQDLVDKYPLPSKDDISDNTNGQHEQSNDATQPDTNTDVDPLTAMVMAETQQQERLQQLELKYRKEKAMRKRGMATNQRVIQDESISEYEDAVMTLQIIDKDLNRLPQQLLDTRIDILRQVLFIFHCENRVLGYRQGMHEVACYLLQVYEADHSKDNVSDITVAANVFFLLQHVMLQIQVSYDVTVPPEYSHQPLQVMSKHILDKVQQHNSQLYNRLYELACPPQLYLTKWIRLLFCREVEQVIDLWDQFIQWVGRDGYTWMNVLEYTATARLLLLGHSLLSLDSGEALHYLMNLPIMTDITPLVTVGKQILDNVGNLTGLPANPSLPSPSLITNKSASTGTYHTTTITTAMPQQPTMARVTTNPQSSYPQYQQQHQNTTTLTPILSALKHGIENAKEQAKVHIEQWRQHDATTTDITTAAHASIAQQHNSSNNNNKIERNYDDPLTQVLHNNHDKAVTESKDHTQQAVATKSVNSNNSNNNVITDKVRTIQNFIVKIEEQRPGSVPAQVWHALADLQRYAVSDK